MWSCHTQHWDQTQHSWCSNTQLLTNYLCNLVYDIFVQSSFWDCDLIISLLTHSPSQGAKAHGPTVWSCGGSTEGHCTLQEVCVLCLEIKIEYTVGACDIELLYANKGPSLLSFYMEEPLNEAWNMNNFSTMAYNHWNSDRAKGLHLSLDIKLPRAWMTNTRWRGSLCYVLGQHWLA